MIVRAEHIFACEHEWIAFPGYFTCHKCKLLTETLPLPGGRKSLLFFPTSVREAAQQKKTG